MNDEQPTLPSMLAKCVAKYGEKIALRDKRDGSWRAWTWNDVLRDVTRAAVALKSLGVQADDRVVMVSENRMEWILCDLAIQFLEAVHVPIHAPLTGPQIAYQIDDCGACVVIVSNAEQAQKLSECRDQISGDPVFVAFESCPPIGEQPPQLWSDLLDISTDAAMFGLSLVDSLATILYTSGTTGEPKGVMLSQNNLVTNTLATLQAFEQTADDIRLSFLPYSHIFARTCDIYTWLATGSQLALAESRETVIADCAEVQPTVLNGVPYFFDRVRRYLEEAGIADDEGSLQKVLGGRMKFCCSGGAALPDHVFNFYERQGIPILQGYGLTETSPVISASTATRNRSGCVGPPIPGVEIKIASDGEILTRGPHVMMGYYKNEDATNEVIRDGWFHTGDLGTIEVDGLLKITGRKKEIIVTAGGKNVAPVLLESLLTEDALILQAMVIGDGRNYLTALIVPDPEKLDAEAESRGVSNDHMLSHPEILKLFDSCIEQRLADLSRYEQVRKFVLLDHGFTIERGELTPKLSLRRQQIADNHCDLIESMYAQSGQP